MRRRIGASAQSILTVQGNLARTYQVLGRYESALSLREVVYSGYIRLRGEEHVNTLISANNYANILNSLQRFEEVKALMRKTVPVARRVLGEGARITLTMRKIFAEASYKNPGATLDDLRGAVTMLEEMERTARRVLGGAHPLTAWIQNSLKDTRAVLRASEGDEVRGDDA